MSARFVWIWGRHPVLEAIRSGDARLILLASGRRSSPLITAIRTLARERAIPINEVQAGEVARVAPGQNTQGIAAQVAERRLSTLTELLAICTAEAAQPFLLALDQIQDPQNLGALLRTADAAGVQGVIMPRRRSAPLSGAVAKVSAGAVSHLPTIEAPNLVHALEHVKRAGIWVIGLDATSPRLLYGADLTVPVMLVVGNEGSGLRRLTRESCDLLLSLPMGGAVASLNAAVAGSIAMYEVVRQRHSATFG